MRFTVVIPARYASTRLPGKPLRKLGSRTMLQHVYDRAKESGASRIIIATDDKRILESARGYCDDVQMTSAEHKTGTDRITEVMELIGASDDEILVNLQGDEPLMPPENIRSVARDLHDHADASISTVSVPIDDETDLHDPNVVKVVTDRAGYAMYFTRAPVPWIRDASATDSRFAPIPGQHCRHVGLYAYRVSFLKLFTRLPSPDIEHLESLEQLRALWAGYRIHVIPAPEPPGPGVDTEQDLENVTRLFERLDQIE